MIQLGLLGLVYSYVDPTSNQGEPKENHYDTH